MRATASTCPEGLAEPAVFVSLERNSGSVARRRRRGSEVRAHCRNRRTPRRQGARHSAVHRPRRGPGRRQRLDQLEHELDERFLGAEAWEEIETWALAGLTLPPDWIWADVRAEVHVKERYFDVLARQRRIDGGPDGGRRELGEEAARHIDAIRQKCPDDFDALARRIEAVIQRN